LADKFFNVLVPLHIPEYLADFFSVRAIGHIPPIFNAWVG
jgi:hypothetical protein